MELVQWFLLGVLFTLSVQALAFLSVNVRLQWYTWAGLIAGVFGVLFGLAWAGASFLEGIAQSGAMGLIFFSGTGVLIIVLVARYLVAPVLGTCALITYPFYAAAMVTSHLGRDSDRVIHLFNSAISLRQTVTPFS